MSLFNSAIQTLSEMAVNESTMELPKAAAPALVDELLETLNNMDSLNENEMIYTVDMIPVRASDRLQKYLIEMEDISRFMLTNGITNISEAVHTILEYNGIGDQMANVALVVDEASILQEVEALGYNISKPDANPTGLGKGLLGPHLDINKFRRFANSKELIDTISGRYGLPLVKKNYNVGLQKMSESAESAVMKPKSPNQTVLQEKPPRDPSMTPETRIDKKSGVNDNNGVGINESAEDSYVDPREEYLQRLRDIASGKYDDEI